MVLRDQRGQTLVEYILLLAVAVSLVITFYNSEAYRRLFGEQGVVGKNMKEQSEFSYMHAYSKEPGTGSQGTGEGGTQDGRDITGHPSYADIEEGGTRFFGPRQTYQ